jgi:hypothetical protein
MNQKRIAALTLHGLNLHDRSWVLGQLGEAHRQEMETLLLELVQLGIPGDASVVKAAISRQGTGQVRVAKPTVPEVSAAALAHVLEGEPDSVVGACLATLDGQKAEGVLSRLPEVRHAAVRDTWQRTTLTPAMRDALSQAVLAQLPSAGQIGYEGASR